MKEKLCTLLQSADHENVVMALALMDSLELGEEEILEILEVHEWPVTFVDIQADLARFPHVQLLSLWFLTQAAKWQKTWVSDITQLRFPHYSLVHIPEDISFLTNLRVFDLSNQAIEVCPAPCSAFTLSEKQWDLWHEDLCLMSQIKHLDLSKARISILPESICGLTQLETLNIKNNNLTEIPSWISRLTTLKHFQGYAQREVPWIFSLTRLSHIDLSYSSLKEVPAKLFQLQELETINLSHNSITTLPLQWEFPKLQEINLGYNELKVVPNALMTLSTLERINLKRNRIEDLSEHLNCADTLQEVDLSENRLKSFPEVLLQCNVLQKLNIDKNYLTRFPAGLERFQEIDLCLLRNPIQDYTSIAFMAHKINKISCKGIPKGLSVLTSLRSIEFQPETLHALPPEFSQYTQLESVCIAHNKLTEIPVALFSLVNLHTLNLGDNKIKEIPPEIGNLTNLRILNFWYNKISQVPKEIEQLTQLQKLSLSQNPLTDQAIEWLEQLPFLVTTG